MSHSLAIAYAMKRKAQKMAKGGMCYAQGGEAGGKSEWHAKPCIRHGAYACEDCSHGAYAEGGFVEKEKASGYEPMPEEHAEHMVEHEIPNQGEDELVDRIMEQRYSMGGRVANDTPAIAGSEENQFDDLVKEDDLEEHYTGENSGDEIGNEHLNHDDEDMVSRIMASRRKKDRMPRPA